MCLSHVLPLSIVPFHARAFLMKDVSFFSFPSFRRCKTWCRNCFACTRDSGKRKAPSYIHITQSMPARRAWKKYVSLGPPLPTTCSYLTSHFFRRFFNLFCLLLGAAFGQLLSMCSSQKWLPDWTIHKSVRETDTELTCSLLGPLPWLPYEWDAPVRHWTPINQYEWDATLRSILVREKSPINLNVHMDRWKDQHNATSGTRGASKAALVLGERCCRARRDCFWHTFCLFPFCLGGDTYTTSSVASLRCL